MAHKLLLLGAALALATTLGGCLDLDSMAFGGDNTDTQETNYGPGRDFTYNSNTWRVSEDKATSHITITAVNPHLAGLGTQAVARYRVDAMPPEEFRAAAEGWFTTTGRFCTPVAEGEGSADSMEFRYTCWEPA